MLSTGSLKNEFRAFFNGKMDLHEVQGLQNLINAETQRQRIVAYSQMRGGHKAVQIRLGGKFGTRDEVNVAEMNWQI